MGMGALQWRGNLSLSEDTDRQDLSDKFFYA